ncbi:helix-turn-helix domain-containing protein [Streptomyces sp. NPDC051917]|uniref:helix-turn-helix domain-containing protein n=1 Tax=Streptomyces sp. NPDC051917 TaxID=3154754 RepID=UPI003453C1CC
MDADDGPVNDLTALGLARYEALVYLALVRRESYTAAEVAREADVPRQRVYDVAPAENLIRPAQAACLYSWRRPPSRSVRHMSR